MSGLRISIQNDDAAIEIVLNDVDPTKSPSGSFLLASTITALIEESNVSGWQQEAHELQPDVFYNLILAAVARHFVQSSPSSPSEITAYDALTILTDSLREKGYLNAKLTDRDGNPYYGES